MDELVHHCLRELSFDGNLGCSVSRLRDFIAGFYASQHDYSQSVDDAFCAFVWSVVVQQPSVRVGVLPAAGRMPTRTDGCCTTTDHIKAQNASDVYIAPQTSAKRKAVAKGEEFVEVVPPSLELVEDARHRHLEDLKRDYGDSLRIAVNPETSFAAITGSHIRPSKLSPMVYSALQLITRGREDGITTVELGRKTNYDQKTCFYLIKQLVELGLIIKARRGGVGNHTCIHKYFVERSPLWQQIQEEARNDEAVAIDKRVKPCETADQVTDQDGSPRILFDPIDSRHLSSLPLVKNRIIKLLKGSRDHMHQSNNLLMTIGFARPTKTDRRFFQTRLRELIHQGVIERILVPSRKSRDRTIKCIRLVRSDNQLPEGSVVVAQDMDEEEKEANLAEDALVGHNEVKTSLTIHKQVSDLLEDAGPSGLTLNEICVSLGNFDKRTIELLLTRASNNRPPAHLSDLGTVDLMETYGRERRHRYFTLAAYKCVMASEQLQDTTTSIIDVDLSRVGDFAALDPKHFYTTTEKLHFHQDSFKDVTTAANRKRKRDEEGSNGEESEPPLKRRRGRPRKTPALTTPPKKRGRPRKNPLTKDGGAQSAASGGSPSKQTAEVYAASNQISKPMLTAGRASSPVPRHDAGVGEKHKDGIPPPSSRPSKRSRSDGGGKSRANINISSLRRENELLKVIENMGGIVNIHSKDIFEAHTALLDSMSQAMEPTSAPVGTRLDKRTAESTLKSLENRGRIKILRTSLVVSSGVNRPAGLVYLPDTSQDKVNAFLRQLSQGVAPTSIGSTEKTPLDAEDADSRLDQICHDTSIPHHVVANTISGEKIVHDVERARPRIKRSRKAEEEQGAEAKSVPRRKAQEMRAERERDWDELLRRIHPEPVKGTLAVRIRAVRTRFMQSTITTGQSHWENEIREAIKETQLVSKKIISQSTVRPNSSVYNPAAGPPPIVPNPPEKSVDSLIAQQGPPITHTTSVKKRGKAKEESEEFELASRRPRFHWTREFDELARDASAIIRARCRASRLDLSAFDQIFPAVPRNSVRQRITHLKDTAAEDAYMKRLEDQWYTLWLRYRGTPYLPDEDPSSPSNFDLITHIEFLRKHVDKNALRVGFMELDVPSKLAASVKDLHKFYEVREDDVSAPAWEFMWGMMVEEGREKQFRSQAFTKEPENVCEDTKNEKALLAEAALKMVFGTPSELYDPDSATRLLQSAGDQTVSIARSDLLHQGVLSKLVRDPKKPKPGRTLKISDTNLNGLGGPFPRDLFQDAISLEDIAVERAVDEMEWPLIASEGDVATLLQLVSEDRVDFTVDLSQSRTARQKIDWNSKRADDEDIEIGIRLIFSRTPAVGTGGNEDQCPESPVTESNSNTVGQEIHGTKLDGEEAACALKSEIGLINCTACINTAFATFASSLSQADRDLARRILERARSSGEIGLNKAECLGLEGGVGRHILWLAHRMTLTSPPILLWIYYNAPMLVAADYCGAWSVVASDEPLTLITPRRWLDLRGYRLDGAWGAAQQAVIGVVFLHPGISQAELRWRLRTVYDRQEIIDLLSSLQEDSVLECRTDASVETIQSLPGWLKTLRDEETVFWFIAKRYHWYQI